MMASRTMVAMAFAPATLVWVAWPPKNVCTALGPTPFSQVVVSAVRSMKGAPVSIATCFTTIGRFTPDLESPTR